MPLSTFPSGLGLTALLLQDKVLTGPSFLPPLASTASSPYLPQGWSADGTVSQADSSSMTAGVCSHWDLKL